MFVGANKLEIDLVFGPARAHLGPVFGFKPSLVIYLRKYGMCIAPEGRSRIGIDLHIGVSSGTEHDSFAVGFFGADQAQCQKQETRDTQMHAPFPGYLVYRAHIRLRRSSRHGASAPRSRSRPS